MKKFTKTSELIKILDDLKITQDVDRLRSRKRRTGKVALRGRVSKVGKSALFVVSKSENIAKAAGAIPGVEVCPAKILILWAIYTNHIIPTLFAKSLALSVELNLTNAFFP